MRITGLATGLDMDKIISDSMKPYRFKIDQTQQKRDIVEMKQMLYRDVIKDSRELYNKYFDVNKPDSLMLSSNYGITKFTSSNDSVVSVKGGAGAKVENYEIKGATATAAKAVVTTNIKKDEVISINGEDFILAGANEKEIADNLNKELKKKGMNVSVRYSDFASTTGTNQSGLVFESTVTGKDSSFTIGGKFNPNLTSNEVQGTNATAATITGFKLQDLKDANGELTINGEKITIDMSKIKPEHIDSDIEKIIQEQIGGKKLTVKVEGENIKFVSTEIGDATANPNIEIGAKSGNFNQGSAGSKSTSAIKMSDIIGGKISVNGNVIDLSEDVAGNTEAEVLEYLKKTLDGQGIAVELDTSNNIVLTSKTVGDKSIKLGVFEGVGSTAVTAGTDTNIVFTDSKGGKYTHTGNSNTVTLDGVTFKFEGKIPTEGITVNGKTDSKPTVDKIVTFINDYNILMEKLNTMTSDKRNKNYMPLTAEQKKEMSETEIKLWNEKAKQGQLHRDSDVARLTTKMKEAMTSMKGATINLESIGIKPVQDYGTKNGTFTVDIDKLTASLEEKPEEIMNFFIGTPPEGTPENEKSAKMGVFQKLKTILYDETVTVTSGLIRKAGIEGSTTTTNNELTRSIEKYNKKMSDLEKDFKRREQALYSKYARLEVSMNKYNSQQSMMAQQIGGQ